MPSTRRCKVTVLALISSIVIFDDAVAYAIDVVAVVAIDQSLVGTLWSDCLNNEWKGYCSRRGIQQNKKRRKLCKLYISAQDGITLRP